MRSKKFIGVLFLLQAISAQAMLIDRGNGMIYDDVLDITWLSDASLGGSMYWYDANAWVENLEFGGFNDWRLPSIDVNEDGAVVHCQSVDEVECRDNELSFMYYQNLLGSQGDDLTGDQGLFTNIQNNHWSSTGSSGTDSYRAFRFDFGSQLYISVTNAYGVWAVRSGDVLAPVPVPGALVLMLSALGFIGLRRHRV